MSEQMTEVKTIGEVERIVHASGLWDGTSEVELSNDGIVWLEAWAPSEEHPVPTFARVTVYRKEVTHPTRKTIRWDEQFPEASEEWAQKWRRAPMRHFSRTVRMIAFRETFRDLLGDITIEDENRNAPAVSAGPTPAVEAEGRDWHSEFEQASTIEALDAIVKEARTARIFKPTPDGTALDRAWKEHRRELNFARELEASAIPAEQPAPVVTAVAWPTELKDRRPTPRDFQRSDKPSAAKRRRPKKRGKR